MNTECLHVRRGVYASCNPLGYVWLQMAPFRQDTRQVLAPRQAETQDCTQPVQQSTEPRLGPVSPNRMACRSRRRGRRRVSNGHGTLARVAMCWIGSSGGRTLDGDSATTCNNSSIITSTEVTSTSWFYSNHTLLASRCSSSSRPPALLPVPPSKSGLKWSLSSKETSKKRKDHGNLDDFTFVWG